MRVPVPLPANMLFKYYFNYLGWEKGKLDQLGVLILNRDHQKCFFQKELHKKIKKWSAPYRFPLKTSSHINVRARGTVAQQCLPSLFYSELYGVAPWFKSHLGWIKLHRASRAALKLRFLNVRVMSHISKNKWQSRCINVSGRHPPHNI